MVIVPETLDVFAIPLVTPPLASPTNITSSNGPSENTDMGISLGVRHRDSSDVQNDENTRKEHNAKREKTSTILYRLIGSICLWGTERQIMTEIRLPAKKTRIKNSLTI
jgi:hypothetical protein